MDRIMTRASLATSFIQTAGWSDAKITPLAGDASNRRYDRLTRPDGSTAVLMDAPPEKGEDVAPFVEIAHHLTQCGLSAPHVLSENRLNGFLLIEDLGDRLFAREILAAPDCEETLYLAAADVLTRLHSVAPPDLDVYNAAITTPLAALAFDWYQLGATGACNTSQKAAFTDRFHDILAGFDSALTVVIQRDFHAENLLWLPDRIGVARVGLLDFQDAMIGHPAYDLVSVLLDARRDVTPGVAEQIKDHFVRQNGLEPDTFETAYAVFGLQRSLRILGVFARLCMRDGKQTYVDLIPRVWGHMQINLQHPALAPIAPLVVSGLPTPTPEILARLKEQRGQWAGR